MLQKYALLFTHHWERTDGFMLSPSVFAQSEIQTALSRIWTWAANSISYDNNHCAKHASFVLVI